MEELYRMERIYNIAMFLLVTAGIGSLVTPIYIWMKHDLSLAVSSFALVFMVILNTIIFIVGVLSCGHGNCTDTTYGIMVSNCIVSIGILGFSFWFGRRASNKQRLTDE